MNALAYRGLTQRGGGRRTPRLRRPPLAAALLALCVLFCLFGAVASASAAAPGKPPAKAPKGTITTTKPTFKWSKAAGATKYELRVYKGSRLLLKKAGLTKLSWKSSKALPKNVSLTWKVRGSNARGAGAWSKSLAFKIVSPYAPQGTITTPRPTFKWSKVTGATKYELRVYKGGKLLLKKTGLKKPSWKSSKALPMYVKLTWKVRGSKGRHTSAWKSFKFTIVPPAKQIALHAGDAQTAVAGTAVAAAPSVLVTDAYNHPVSGVSVTFLVASGDGSLTGASPTTNASGIATVGSWTLGTIAGANTLTATKTGLTGSPVTFSATGLTIGTPYGGGVVGYILQSGDPGYVAGKRTA